MKTLRERLSDWTDEDIAEYHLAVVLGYFEDAEQPTGDWNGNKGTIWSDNPVGRALYNSLQCMVIGGVLLFDDTAHTYRWNHEISENSQTIPMEKS